MNTDTEDDLESRIKANKKADPNRHPRSRIGKTRKDRESGAKQRNYENKDARVAWQHGGNNSTISNFPFTHCNGKRNRSVRTGKGNSQIRLTYKVGGVSKVRR